MICVVRAEEPFLKERLLKLENYEDCYFAFFIAFKKASVSSFPP